MRGKMFFFFGYTDFEGLKFDFENSIRRRKPLDPDRLKIRLLRDNYYIAVCLFSPLFLSNFILLFISN